MGHPLDSGKKALNDELEAETSKVA